MFVRTGVFLAYAPQRVSSAPIGIKGNLPRRIDDWRVDSPSVHGAFLEYCGRLDPERAEYRDLSVLTYKPDQTSSRLEYNMEAWGWSCMFRWCSRRWYPFYERSAEPRAWVLN